MKKIGIKLPRDTLNMLPEASRFETLSYIKWYFVFNFFSEEVNGWWKLRGWDISLNAIKCVIFFPLKETNTGEIVCEKFQMKFLGIFGHTVGFKNVF